MAEVKTEATAAPASEEVKTEETKTEAKTEEPKTEVKAEEAKTEPAETGAEAPSLLEMKIIRQVEYYFGNVNLSRDKFLKEKVKEDDGWVTLECLITFNRLQSLSMDFTEIITALEKSKTGILEIHSDKLKIRRSPSNPVPDPDDPIARKASKMKTLYVKGFPTTYTLDDVQDFILSQQCQNIFVKMKYDEDRKFKGSILVELSTFEEAEKFLKNEIKCQDTVLTVMKRDDYFNEKSEKRYGNNNNKRRGSDDEEEGAGGKKPKEDGGEEAKVPPRLGSVLHFKGCSTETLREDFKELFGAHEPIEWVDFDKGDTQGYIRFENEGGAQKALDAVKAANENKVVVKDVECETKVVEGIEEKNYWILANEEKKRARNNRNNRNGRGGGRGRGRGGRGGRGGYRGGRKGGDEGWRKRKREWEYGDKKKNGGEGDDNSENKNTTNEEAPAKNSKITFDDNGNAPPVGEKKAKVEEKPAAAAVVEA